MFPSFAYSAPVILLTIVFLRAGVTQDLSDSSVTVELLDNRSTYCTGETAHIRCRITGSENDSDSYFFFDWLIDSVEYNPETIAQRVPGHTVSSSDRFVLQVFQTKIYRANYSCNSRTLKGTIRSRAKQLIFANVNISALTVTCTNTTSNSAAVVVRETNRCRPTKVEVTIGGTINCFTTGHELYFCAGLQAQTTYTISAVATARSNGSVLATTLGTAVCTTGTVKATTNIITGNDGSVVGVLAALLTISILVNITSISFVIICCRHRHKMHIQEVTVAMSSTSIAIRGGEDTSAANETQVSNEQEVTDNGKKKSETVRGTVYAELDFAGSAQPIKPPPAFDNVQYAGVL